MGDALHVVHLGRMPRWLSPMLRSMPPFSELIKVQASDRRMCDDPEVYHAVATHVLPSDIVFPTDDRQAAGHRALCINMVGRVANDLSVDERTLLCVDSYLTTEGDLIEACDLYVPPAIGAACADQPLWTILALAKRHLGLHEMTPLQLEPEPQPPAQPEPEPEPEPPEPEAGQPEQPERKAPPHEAEPEPPAGLYVPPFFVPAPVAEPVRPTSERVTTTLVDDDDVPVVVLQGALTPHGMRAAAAHRVKWPIEAGATSRTRPVALTPDGRSVQSILVDGALRVDLSSVRDEGRGLAYRARIGTGRALRASSGRLGVSRERERFFQRR